MIYIRPCTKERPNRKLRTYCHEEHGMEYLIICILKDWVKTCIVEQAWIMQLCN